MVFKVSWVKFRCPILVFVEPKTASIFPKFVRVLFKIHPIDASLKLYFLLSNLIQIPDKLIAWKKINVSLNLTLHQ